MIRKTAITVKGFLFILVIISASSLNSCKQQEDETVFKERIAYVANGIIHVEGLKDNTHTEVGPGSEPSLSFDGRYLAYVNNVGSKQRIAILDFPNRNTNIIEDVQGTSWHPVWSPTENNFLFSAKVDFKGSPYLVAIVGHAREENKYVIAREGVNILSPAWASDGASVFAHDTRHLFQFEKTGALLGHAVLKDKFGDLEYNESTVILPSPSGSYWLIGTGAEESAGRTRKTSFTLFLFDEMNRSLRRVSPEDFFISDFNWSSDSLGVIFSGKENLRQRQTDIYRLSLTDGSISRLKKNATQPSCRSIQFLPTENQGK